MEARAKAAGHPVHQQLIVFPLGLLGMAVVFDLLRLITDNDDLAKASYYMIAAGLVTGVVAGLFGTIDYLGIPKGTRARRVGFAHGLGNEVMLALFLVSWLLRHGDDDRIASGLALAFALAGAAISVLTGWLGGELVDRLGVGVDDDANLDAPASLKTGLKLR